MNITDVLLSLDPSLNRHNEGNWADGYSPKVGGYSSFNDAGLECETGEFLYGLIRALKPINVLETGTHVGVGASYMGLALKHNGLGHLDTIEFLPELHQQAVKRLANMLLLDYVHPHFCDARNFEPGDKTYQLILLDTEPQTRFSELIKFYEYLSPGGFVFIHDLHRHMAQICQNPDHPNEPFWPWGELPEAIKTLVVNGDLHPMHFPTPRGLTGFYKRHADDYKWYIAPPERL